MSDLAVILRKIYILVLILGASACLLVSQVALAQGVPEVSFTPAYGGRIILNMPISHQPPPATGVCPPHRVVFTTDYKVIGIIGGFDYAYERGAPAEILGRYFNVRLPTCIGACAGLFCIPWPVYIGWFQGTSQF